MGTNLSGVYLSGVIIGPGQVEPPCLPSPLPPAESDFWASSFRDASTQGYSSVRITGKNISTISYSVIENKYKLVVQDYYGEVILSKTLDFIGILPFTSIEQIMFVQDESNNYYIGATGIVNSNTSHPIILKLDSDGNLMWNHIIFNTPAGTTTKYLIRDMKYKYGILYAVMDNHRTSIVPSHTVIAKIDASDGAVYENFGVDYDRARFLSNPKIEIDSDSYIILSADTYQNADGDEESINKFSIMKFDPDGVLLWGYEYGNVLERELASSITIDEDDNVYATFKEDTIYHVLKIDVDGGLLWNLSTEADAYYAMLGSSIMVNENGVYLSTLTIAQVGSNPSINVYNIETEYGFGFVNYQRNYLPVVPDFIDVRDLSLYVSDDNSYAVAFSTYIEGEDKRAFNIIKQNIDGTGFSDFTIDCVEFFFSEDSPALVSSSIIGDPFTLPVTVIALSNNSVTVNLTDINYDIGIVSINEMTQCLPSPPPPADSNFWISSFRDSWMPQHTSINISGENISTISTFEGKYTLVIRDRYGESILSKALDFSSNPEFISMEFGGCVQDETGDYYVGFTGIIDTDTTCHPILLKLDSDGDLIWITRLLDTIVSPTKYIIRDIKYKNDLLYIILDNNRGVGTDTHSAIVGIDKDDGEVISNFTIDRAGTYELLIEPRIEIDSSGNIIVCSESSQEFDSKFSIMKFQPDGTLLWAYEYGSSSQQNLHCSLTIDSSNNIHAAFKLNETQYIITLDTMGNERWILATEDNFSQIYSTSVISADSGLYLLTLMGREGENPSMNLYNIETEYGDIDYQRNYSVSEVETSIISPNINVSNGNFYSMIFSTYIPSESKATFNTIRQNIDGSGFPDFILDCSEFNFSENVALLIPTTLSRTAFIPPFGGISLNNNLVNIDLFDINYESGIVSINDDSGYESIEVYPIIGSTLFLDNFNSPDDSYLEHHQPDVVFDHDFVSWTDPNQNYKTNMGFAYFSNSAFFNTPIYGIDPPIAITPTYSKIIMDIGIIWGNWYVPGPPADVSVEFSIDGIGVRFYGTNEPDVKEIYIIGAGSALVGTIPRPAINSRSSISVEIDASLITVILDGISYSSSSVAVLPDLMGEVKFLAFGPNDAGIRVSHKIDSIHIYGVEGPSGPVYTPTFLDTFDGAVGTNIAQRPPNIGPAWNDYDDIPGVIDDNSSLKDYFDNNNSPTHGILNGSGLMQNNGWPIGMTTMMPIPYGYIRFGFILPTLPPNGYWQYDTNIISQQYLDGVPLDSMWGYSTLNTRIGIDTTAGNNIFYARYSNQIFVQPNPIADWTPRPNEEYSIEYLFYPDRIEMWLKNLTAGGAHMIAQEMVAGSFFASRYPDFKFAQSPSVSQMAMSGLNGYLTFTELGTWNGIPPTEAPQPPPA